jgi:mRNA-degrading endonuclease RelE of RelBE toxin-antitoxin system
MAEAIELVLTEELKKRYQELPEHIQKKFDKQLRFLQENPKHPSLKIPPTKLDRKENSWGMECVSVKRVGSLKTY